MKELTKKQKDMADNVINTLKKLFEQGVVAVMMDDRNGLTFWKPTPDEVRCSYAIIHGIDPDKANEFKETSYYPTNSTGFFINYVE